MSSKRWYLIDAQGVPLGRLATQVAPLLRGKEKPDFSYHLDQGDGVIVVNACQVLLTGRKEDQKLYFRHSGYPGGTRFIPASKLRKTRPDELVRHAVKGMLPKTRLGAKMFGRLKVYPGDFHPHISQKPEKVEWQR